MRRINSSDFPENIEPVITVRDPEGRVGALVGARVIALEFYPPRGRLRDPVLYFRFLFGLRCSLLRRRTATVTTPAMTSAEVTKNSPTYSGAWRPRKE
jgi:hypothetical protein